MAISIASVHKRVLDDQDHHKGTPSKEVRRATKPGKIWLLGELCDRRLLNLHVSKKVTVGALKDKLCSSYGYDPDQHSLMYQGELLRDRHLLKHYKIKEDDEVKIVFTMKLKRIKDPWESASEESEPYDFGDEDSEEEPASRRRSQGSSTSSSSGRSKESDASNSTQDTLRRHLTAGGLHVMELPSPNKLKRLDARETARETGISHYQERQREKAEKANLASMFSEMAQNLLPDAFARCTPSPSPDSSSRCFCEKTPAKEVIVVSSMNATKRPNRRLSFGGA